MSLMESVLASAIQQRRMDVLSIEGILLCCYRNGDLLKKILSLLVPFPFDGKGTWVKVGLSKPEMRFLARYHSQKFMPAAALLHH
jgi:hypothetical protein